MKVEQLMQRTVHTCGPDDSLNEAARRMWEYDCGCLPVVDRDAHVLGMLTDRDVCMAAYTQGGPLRALRVASAMARVPKTCRGADTIAEAEHIMRAAQVRRLPVVDATNRVIGILSLNDIALEAAREAGRPKRDVLVEDLAGTLAGICMPRESRMLAGAAA